MRLPSDQSWYDNLPLTAYHCWNWREDAIRHPPKIVLVENGFWIHNPNPKPKPNFGYQYLWWMFDCVPQIVAILFQERSETFMKKTVNLVSILNMNCSEFASVLYRTFYGYAKSFKWWKVFKVALKLLVDLFIAADPQGGSTLILAWVAVSRAQTSFPELCKANRISTRVDLSVCMSTQFMTFCDVNRLPSIYGSLLRRLPSIYGSSTSLLRIFRTFGIDNREVIVNAHWPAVNN